MLTRRYQVRRPGKEIPGNGQDVRYWLGNSEIEMSEAREWGGKRVVRKFLNLLSHFSVLYFSEFFVTFQGFFRFFLSHFSFFLFF